MTSVLNAELLKRATNPPIVLASGAVRSLLRDRRRDSVLLTQPEPLELLPRGDLPEPDAIRLVTSLDAVALAELEASLPARGTVIGIGGGMVMDAAKYVAWRRGIRLYLAPSIVSVDACVTNTIAVRREGIVGYEGFVVADGVIVDPDFVRSAPSALNRAGVGDLVSIHTGLRDWALGADRGLVAFDADVAAAAQRVFDDVERQADEIAAVSDRGIETIIEGYVSVNALSLRMGHSQMEEGSEHYFGYCVEHMTGRSFVHGQLIGLGTVLMAALQNNDPERPRRLLDRASVAWRPSDLELDRATLMRTLVALPEFARKAGLPYSVAHEPVPPEQAEKLVEDVCAGS